MKAATDVYRAYDKDGALLYVGLTCDLANRLAQHKQSSSWFSEMARLSVQHFGTRREAARVEAQAIRDERPRYNVVTAADRRPVSLRVQGSYWAMANRLAGGALESILCQHRTEGSPWSLISRKLYADFGVEVSDMTLKAWCAELGIEDKAGAA